MPYNQENQNQLRLRHLFFPSILGFLTELVLSVGIITLFNLNSLGSRLLHDSVNDVNPTSFGAQYLNSFLSRLSNNNIFEQVSLFLFWAIIGIIIYLILYWVTRIATGSFFTVKEGVEFAKTDGVKGLSNWFDSLHDVLVRVLLVVCGAVLLLFGVFIVLNFASYQLNSALLASGLGAIEHLALSIVSGIIGIRLALISLSILIPAFRRWYCA